MNYVRKVTGRNWPTPIKYIGGGANGKVYLTNSGKLMKVVLGSHPQEFRPLHTLKNTKFVPKFNQRNWAIVPISKRSFGKRTFLFNSKVVSQRPIKRKLKKVISQIAKTNNKNMENILKEEKNLLMKAVNLQKQKNKALKKKVTIFLMNRVGNAGNKVMTLQEFLSTRGLQTWNKVRQVLKDIVKKLHNRGVSHGDLHTANILVSIGPRGFRLWVIDFGRSTVIPVGMSEANIFKQLYRIGKLKNGIPVHYGPRGLTHIANKNSLKRYGVKTTE